jgi:hypothetical protein
VWKTLVEIHLRPGMNYGCHWTEFHETHPCLTNIGKNSYNEFHENPTDGLVAGNRSLARGMDGRVCTQGVLFHEERLTNTRWFKYDRDKLWLVYTQIVPVIFEPPCTYQKLTAPASLQLTSLFPYSSSTDLITSIKTGSRLWRNKREISNELPVRNEESKTHNYA